jgi:hypothetical protein
MTSRPLDRWPRLALPSMSAQCRRDDGGVRSGRRTTRVEVVQEGDHLVAREIPLTAEEQVEADVIHEREEAKQAALTRRKAERERVTWHYCYDGRGPAYTVSRWHAGEREEHARMIGVVRRLGPASHDHRLELWMATWAEIVDERVVDHLVGDHFSGREEATEALSRAVDASAHLTVPLEETVRRPKLEHLTPGKDLAGRVRRVALVACSNRKRATILPARDLYCGRTFTAARAWAEEHADAWFVLSALHSVVDPRRELEPYDYAFSHLDAESRRCKVRAMATSVVNLIAHLTDDDHGRRDGTFGAGLELVCLAGGPYAAAVRMATVDEPGYRGTVSFPLAGLAIGQQYAWLKTNSETNTAGETNSSRPREAVPVEHGDQLALTLEEHHHA